MKRWTMVWVSAFCASAGGLLSLSESVAHAAASPDQGSDASGAAGKKHRHAHGSHGHAISLGRNDERADGGASASGSSKNAHHHRRGRSAGAASADSASGATAQDHAASAPSKASPRTGKHARAVETGARHREASADAETAASSKKTCMHEPITIERGFGGEVEPLVLTRCSGQPAPDAVERLSVIIRPQSAPKPNVLFSHVRHVTGVREWAPGIRLADAGLVTRLQKVVDNFKARKVTIVSGYRPASLGSFHQSARAIDMHLEGISNEQVVAFCRTLADTGCGYYPNSSFVHMDVRAPRTGHVYWIDASGPGESPRYVAAWPLKDNVGNAMDIPRPDPAAPNDELTHPDATRPQLPALTGDTKVDATTTAPATPVIPDRLDDAL